MKKKFDKVANWINENKEIVTAVAVASLGGVALVALVSKEYKQIKRSETYPWGTGQSIEMEEDTTTGSYRFLYQLTDQDQRWALITTEYDVNGNVTDLEEMGRQIAEGLFREE